jgi:hypothetical protein
MEWCRSDATSGHLRREDAASRVEGGGAYVRQFGLMGARVVHRPGAARTRNQRQSVALEAPVDGSRIRASQPPRHRGDFERDHKGRHRDGYAQAADEISRMEAHRSLICNAGVADRVNTPSQPFPSINERSAGGAVPCSASKKRSPSVHDGRRPRQFSFAARLPARGRSVAADRAEATKFFLNFLSVFFAGIGGTNGRALHCQGDRPPISPSPCSAGHLGRSRH